KTVEGRRIVDENAVADPLVWRPLCEQIEEYGIIGHLLLAAMRPVAAPHHPLGRGVGIGLSRLGCVRIGRSPACGIQVSARELHPRVALVEELADHWVG